MAVSEFLHERGDLPIDLWKQAITTVPVYGGIECTKGGGMKNLTADEYRQAATQLIKTGADGVYLFNFFTSREGGENAYEPPFEARRRRVGVSPPADVDESNVGKVNAPTATPLLLRNQRRSKLWRRSSALHFDINLLLTADTAKTRCFSAA